MTSSFEFGNTRATKLATGVDSVTLAVCLCLRLPPILIVWTPGPTFDASDSSSRLSNSSTVVVPTPHTMTATLQHPALVGSF